MKLEKIPFREDERGVIYGCGPLNYIKRKKGTISADHSHEDAETLYLIMGEVELTISEETQAIKAPVKITIAPNEYHKLIALSDIELLEDREDDKINI